MDNTNPTPDQLLDLIDCLGVENTDPIEFDYINGLLSEEESAAFERSLADDPDYLNLIRKERDEMRVLNRPERLDALWGRIQKETAEAIAAAKQLQTTAQDSSSNVIAPEPSKPSFVDGVMDQVAAKIVSTFERLVADFRRPVVALSLKPKPTPYRSEDGLHSILERSDDNGNLVLVITCTDPFYAGKRIRVKRSDGIEAPEATLQVINDNWCVARITIDAAQRKVVEADVKYWLEMD